MKTISALLCVALLTPGPLFASTTIDLEYAGIVGGGSAPDAYIDSRAYRAGHLTHVIRSGSRAGESFTTFCIEIAESVQGGVATYEIVDLADAPNPGSSFGQERADAANSVIANAVAMGWIDRQLRAVSSDSDLNLDRMGAIQAALWEALGHSFDASSPETGTGLAFRYAELTDESTFDDSLRISGLVAAVAEGQQDALYVVPLPLGGLAGLGILGGVLGMRIARRR